MPLDKIARRYAEQLFVGKMEKATRDQQERIESIKRDFASRGAISSGAYIRTLADLGVAQVENLAQARTDSFLAAFQKAKLPLTNQAVEEILAEVIQLCETQKRHLAKRIEKEIRRMFGTYPPTNLQRTLSQSIERSVSRIVADIRRELGIKRDEAILESRQVRPIESTHTPEWDVFISHASEDKQEFVRPLADALEANGLRVWYDDFELDVGDSLRESIDRGLSRSRYGVVVLSQHFFEKHWPQKELDGLVAKESGHEKIILPVWHKLHVDEVRRFSPTLAGRVAAKSSEGLHVVVAKLLRAMGMAPDRNVSLAVSAMEKSTPQCVSGERFQRVIEDYERRGTPKDIIDTFDDLSLDEKANLYDRAVRWKKRRGPKTNPYRREK